MMGRRLISPCLLLLAWAATISAHAQEPPERKAPPEPTYAIQSQLVQVFLTVMDGTRRITDLRMSDFSLSEDGKPQKVDRLDSETVPLQIALLLDTSDSMVDSLSDTQEAAVTFVQSMKPGDRVTLIPFNTNIHSIPQLTDDFSPILRAIRSARAQYKTKLYDALLYAVKILSVKEGRKAVVVFSDGEDTASASSLNHVLNASSRYGYPIYTVSAGPAIRGSSFRDVLRQLADINSGKMFLVENARELRSAFMGVSSELRAAYVLYYYTLQSDERWHDLAVSVANPRYQVYARKGFYTGKLGSASARAELGKKGMEKAPLEGPEPAVLKENARIALDEVVTPPAVPRKVDPVPDNSATAASGAKTKAPTIKVESHLVEVPVLVEPLDGREPPPFSEKDFQIYEDSGRREIAYFARSLNKEELQRVRDLAMEKAGAGTTPLSPSGGDELILGKYYLILDDLTADALGFLNSKKAAEEIIRKYHGALRPFSVYFTSRGRAGISDNVEAMLDEIRKAGSSLSPSLNPEREAVTVYEASLIDRRDEEAQELGELRVAASLGLKFTNRLGRVDGACADATATLPMGRGDTFTCDPSANVQTVQSNLRAEVAELVTRNAVSVRRNLDGLREVINAAAADQGSYSKTIIFLSPGFVVGRDTRGDASSLLESVASIAKRRKIRIYAVDTGGSVAEIPSLSPAFGDIQGPALAILNSHTTAWQFEKASSLDHLTSQSGGKRLKADNDVPAAVGSAISASGALYYMAFLSRQPADGRFHKIGVLVSSRSVRLHARQGYYARPQIDRKSGSVAATGSEDVTALVAKADHAMKNGDYPNLANALEGLARKFPYRPDIWFNLGVAYFNSKNPMGAVEAFQRVLALSPQDRTAGLMLSRSFTAAGNAEAAAETLQEMRRRRPLDLELLIQLGRVYEADSQPGKAYEVYRSALDILSAPPLDFYFLLIRTSAALGRRGEAGVFIRDYLARGGTGSRIEPWKRMIEREPR